MSAKPKCIAVNCGLDAVQRIILPFASRPCFYCAKHVTKVAWLKGSLKTSQMLSVDVELMFDEDSGDPPLWCLSAGYKTGKKAGLEDLDKLTIAILAKQKRGDAAAPPPVVPSPSEVPAGATDE